MSVLKIFETIFPVLFFVGRFILWTILLFCGEVGVDGGWGNKIYTWLDVNENLRPSCGGDNHNAATTLSHTP